MIVSVGEYDIVDMRKRRLVMMKLDRSVCGYRLVVMGLAATYHDFNSNKSGMK